MTQPAGAPPPPAPPPAAGFGLHPLSLGRVLELTFGMLRFRWRALVGAAVLPIAPVYLVGAVIQIPFVQTINQWILEIQLGGGFPRPDVPLPRGWAEAAVVLLGVGIVQSLATLVAIGAVTHAAGVIYSGGGGSARTSVARALRRLPSILGAYVLYFLALMTVLLVGGVLSVAFFAGAAGGGLLPFLGLVVVVGAVATALFLLVRWALIVPVLVLEDIGAVEAMGRSWRLVAGSGWRVLGYVFVIGLMVGVVGAVMIQVAYLVSGGSALPTDNAVILAQSLMAGAVTMLLMPVLPIALTLLYFDLRWRRGELPTR
ncbi:MAG TPA: glycerophosphoryl diester phosphodiesterase membrane domain-containing protein [Candidatus Caenarcaniphilales bacterium]|nr:glycerophosphoryl diester phosphodiesterase membrane domain-containing protein [Candidatus Caenarcaniphilales bacterium]